MVCCQFSYTRANLSSLSCPVLMYWFSQAKPECFVCPACSSYMPVRDVGSVRRRGSIVKLFDKLLLESNWIPSLPVEPMGNGSILPDGAIGRSWQESYCCCGWLSHNDLKKVQNMFFNPAFVLHIFWWFISDSTQNKVQMHLFLHFPLVFIICLFVILSLSLSFRVLMLPTFGKEHTKTPHVIVDVK